MTKNFEDKRLALQEALDKEKSARERNVLGQYATPTVLAEQIIGETIRLFDQKNIRYLDPAFGTGSFYSALLKLSGKLSLTESKAFEIDPHYGEPSKKLWSHCQIEVLIRDFTSEAPPILDNEKFNFVICNPPYVRHHHLSLNEKRRLQFLCSKMGIRIDGLSGLYSYFLLLTHNWLQKNAISSWLVPSEFMDVNYGTAVKSYLLDNVELLRIHRFNPKDVQFDDALVSSAVIWFKNSGVAPQQVEFTYGGTIESPDVRKLISKKDLINETKWTRYPLKGARSLEPKIKLSSLFDIKRGLATGDNNFFLLTSEKAAALKIPRRFLTPILPSPRFLSEVKIEANSTGDPKILSKLYLLNCDLEEIELKKNWPAVWNYLQTGKATVGERFLCKSRKIWYLQEKRTPSPILCTYIGRTDVEGKVPFRFILNESNAVATNSYLMLYPTLFLKRLLQNDPLLIKKIWEDLQKLPASNLLDEGRVYGGGMHKLEPKELAEVDITGIVKKHLNDYSLPSMQLNMNLEESKMLYQKKQLSKTRTKISSAIRPD